MKPRSEGITVVRDETSRRWQVVDDDGTILEDGFSTNASAWRWIDDRYDQEFEEQHDRIRNAMRER